MHGLLYYITIIHWYYNLYLNKRSDSSADTAFTVYCFYHCPPQTLIILHLSTHLAPHMLYSSPLQSEIVVL